MPMAWSRSTEKPHYATKDNNRLTSVCTSGPAKFGMAGVKRTESGGCSFVDAVWDKFNGEMAVDDCIGIYVPKKGPAKITESGHLILPWQVHMTDCGITVAGQHADMAGMCQHVTELDLAHNNIMLLREVLQVIRCMPNLTFLNLTSNPLHSSPSTTPPPAPQARPDQPVAPPLGHITTVTSTTTTTTRPSPATPDQPVAPVGTTTIPSPATPNQPVAPVGTTMIPSPATPDQPVAPVGTTTTTATTTRPSPATPDQPVAPVGTITTTTPTTTIPASARSDGPVGLPVGHVTITTTTATLTSPPPVTSNVSQGPSGEGLSSCPHSSPGGTIVHTSVSEGRREPYSDDTASADIESWALRSPRLVADGSKEEMSETGTTQALAPAVECRLSASGEQDQGEATVEKGEATVVRCRTPSAPSSHPSPFPTVRQLVLNDTGVSWPDVVHILGLFPSLEELHLSINQYSTVDLPAGLHYPSLLRLFFNNNPVQQWRHIGRFGRAFPNLQQLFLADTAILSLENDDDHDGDNHEAEKKEDSTLARLFPSLTLLSLSKTGLGDWRQVDRLRLFPSLVDVRLQGIAFLEAMEEKARRQQLVARLPNITRLNGSNIMAEERLDAERAFIRLFLDREDKPDRYYELEQVYGKLDPLVKVSLEPQFVFKVHVVMDDRREPLELNTKQTVRDLKKSLQNMAGLPSSKFSLYYHDKLTHFGPDKLKYPDKELYTYNIADGDEFIIVPKD